ncbi:uncharacterized protein LOC127780594 [Oryza glaberrima]|uniref:Uncharacterized protein n=2 Tax=Oryza TaxID=4527 RepID=A0A0D3GSY7_9ORYZ|nr:uncharacterized protein LOC127780594 [Oryza glaberrima]
MNVTPTNPSNQPQQHKQPRPRDEGGEKITKEERGFVAKMEGLIPFVIDAIRRSNDQRGGYRGVSSQDGSSHGGGGGSRRHLIDYWELAGSAAEDARPGSVQATGAAEDERSRPPAAVVAAGSAYRRK